MPTPKRKPVPPEPDPETPPELPRVSPEPEPAPADEPEPGVVTLVNPGTSAVVYSLDGRQLGGGESVRVDEVDVVGLTAIERGYLTRR